jgi:hypothetical protein
MRKRNGTERAIVALCAAIVIACFAGMLALGLTGCMPQDEEPIPQEYPKEELWEAETDQNVSALTAEPEGPQLAAGAAGYDRQRAKWYIERYAKDPNLRFSYCGDWTLEGKRPVKVAADCTNFASQVLSYGGLPMRKGGAGDPGWWSEGGCRPWNSSDSWRQVYPLINELLSVSRRGEVVPDVRRLNVGDLIFYRLRDASHGYACPQEAIYNHTTVVSGFAKDGTPLVAYHSNDALNVPWNARNGSHGSLGEACGVLLVHIKD